MTQLNSILKSALNNVAQYPAITLAVVYPASVDAILAAVEGMEYDLVRPIFVGPEKLIRNIMEENHISQNGIIFKDTPEGDYIHAGQVALDLVRNREAMAIMKGSLKSDAFLKPLVKAKDLHTTGTLSHTFYVAKEGKHPFFVTDGAMNFSLQIEKLPAYIANAWQYMQALGEQMAFTAFITASETYMEKSLASTYARNAVMYLNDHMKHDHVVCDGPLSFDLAYSQKSADIKKSSSPVAGKANLMVFDSLDSANAVVKSAVTFGDAIVAGLVLGLSVPVILTSRADSVESRLLSLAHAIALIAHKKDS